MLVYNVLISVVSVLILLARPGISTLAELKDVLQQAAGVYLNTSRIYDYPTYEEQLKRTVVVTAANFGYLNQLLNLKCFLDRLGLKLLVMSMDQEVHTAINLWGGKDPAIFSYFLSTDELFHGNETISSKSVAYNSQQYIMITMMKIQAGLDILELGYDFLFLDPDIAVVRDPMKHLLVKNVDYLHTIDLMCDTSMPNSRDWDFYNSIYTGNTGFFLARSSNKTINFFKKVIETAPLMPSFHLLPRGQITSWYVLHKRLYPVKPLVACKDQDTESELMVTCPLDNCQFSQGALSDDDNSHTRYLNLLNSLDKLKLGLVAVHANYIASNHRKVHRLKETGFWITDWPASNRCHPYERNFP